MSKTAVILFNLGGPDSMAAVQPFLFNLFSDKAIITVPQPFRYFLARLISTGRKEAAQEIYAKIGGKSPIKELTRNQADALEKKLGTTHKVFVCMRYWHPMTEQVVADVKNYAPDNIILLPLYPQFSTTTTASSFREWEKQAKKIGLTAPTKKICCYPIEKDFIAAHVELIKQKLEHSPRVLFSAHGLPEKIIAAGDSYQWQVEQTVGSVMQQLPGVDHSICYQSRVGPLKWIGPSLQEELERAVRDQKDVLIVPIAFVSEHSETLVELDMEYKHIADNLGIKRYGRVPALAVQEQFITSLARLCVDACAHKPIASCTGNRLCPKEFSQCLMST